MMKRFILSMVLLLTLSGCQLMSSLGNTIAGWGSPSASSANDAAASLANATAASGAVDRMTEIARREAEARKELDAKYEKFAQEIRKAYAERERIDNQNFDRISEINYGILAATEDIISLDRRVLIANLKSKENAALLMPVSESKKKEIASDIAVDKEKPAEDIIKKYVALTKQAEEMAKKYAEADKLVKEKEAEKVKLQANRDAELKKIKEDQEASLAKIKSDTNAAVETAKEAERLLLIGWISKALGGVGVILLLIGLLMKSPTFIVSGLLLLGLAIVAASIPFWAVASITGVFLLAMIAVDPKTGKISLLEKKKPEGPPQAPPATPPPPSTPAI